MPSLRSPEGKKKYKEYLKTMSPDGSCPLCEKDPLQLFAYWKIIENSFPYDLVADTHHMIAPLRHVVEEDLNQAELKELKEIKAGMIQSTYDYIIEGTQKMKSLPGHFHLHLLIGKA